MEAEIEVLSYTPRNAKESKDRQQPPEAGRGERVRGERVLPCRLQREHLLAP